MITVLGVRRVVILLALIGVNLVLAAVHYGYLIHYSEQVKKEVSTLSAKETGLRSDINKLQIEFAQLEGQREEFEALRKNGFFTDQPRDVAVKILKDVENISKVLSARVEVKPGQIIEHPEAAKANHKLLSSVIEVNLKAMEDQDVYRYIYFIRRMLPGIITFQEINLKREINVTGSVLASIVSGSNPELVSANIKMQWSSLITNEKAEESLNAGGGGRATP